MSWSLSLSGHTPNPDDLPKVKQAVDQLVSTLAEISSFTGSYTDYTEGGSVTLASDGPALPSGEAAAGSDSGAAPAAEPAPAPEEAPAVSTETPPAVESPPAEAPPAE